LSKTFQDTAPRHSHLNLENVKKKTRRSATAEKQRVSCACLLST